MSIDKVDKMTSAVASSFRSPLSPSSSKKRLCSEEISSSHRPVKRLQSLNLPPKLSGATSKEPSVPQKSGLPLTGLEGLLKLDQHFVESTKASEDDEAKLGLQPTADLSYKATIIERRKLASEIPSSLDASMGSGRGLKNFAGNLCYRHSLFQALLHTPKFVSWLYEYHMADDCVSDNPDDCISCQMRNLIFSYWDRKVKANEVCHQLKYIHELFKRLGWNTHSANDHGDPDDQLAWMLGVMRTEMPSRVFNIFDAFHNSLLESEIKCGQCGHASRTQGNNERHLSIPIKVPGLANRHLSLLVTAYMDEVINGYRCENEKCKFISDKHRIQKIAFAPDILLVQLKRFNFRGQKDHSLVTYGPRLDLSPHSANPSLGPLTYDLTSVISHSGSANFGHYHCVSKAPDGKWWDFDDNQIFRSNVKEAMNPTLIDKDWTPYLLFYERNKASMPPQ